MSKIALRNKLAEKAEISYRDADDVLFALVRIIQNELAFSGNFSFPDVGRFEVQDAAIKFHPSKTLTRFIKGAKNDHT